MVNFLPASSECRRNRSGSLQANDKKRKGAKTKGILYVVDALAK